MPESQVRLSVSERMTARTRDHHWLRIGLMGTCFVAVLGALYAQVLLVWLQDVWDDPNYTHAFFVPVVSGFIVWRRRHALAALVPQGRSSGLPVLLAGVTALILGDIGGETFLMRTSLIVVLAGLVLFHLGPDFLRALAFPLAFLLFAVPMPAIFFYPMTAHLQNVAAESGALVLDLVGVPILLDGNVIHLSRITLGVTEACSGIRSLITLASLGVAWAYLMLPQLWMRAALVAVVLPITVAANASRIVLTGLIGQWFGIEYAEGFFHFFASWFIFVVALVCLLGAHALLQAVAARRSRRTA